MSAPITFSVLESRLSKLMESRDWKEEAPFFVDAVRCRDWRIDNGLHRHPRMYKRIARKLKASSPEWCVSKQMAKNAKKATKKGKPDDIDRINVIVVGARQVARSLHPACASSVAAYLDAVVLRHFGTRLIDHEHSAQEDPLRPDEYRAKLDEFCGKFIEVLSELAHEHAQNDPDNTHAPDEAETIHTLGALSPRLGDIVKELQKYHGCWVPKKDPTLQKLFAPAHFSTIWSQVKKQQESADFITAHFEDNDDYIRYRGPVLPVDLTDAVSDFASKNP